MSPTIAPLNVTLTERASRVFLASRGEGTFTLQTTASSQTVPCVGDEMKFPDEVTTVVFIVVKRQFQYGRGDQAPSINLLLDVVEGDELRSVESLNAPSAPAPRA